MSQTSYRTGRSFAAASFAAGLLSFGIVAIAHAQQPTPDAVKPAAIAAQPTMANPEETARATLRSETRIRRLHDRLGITAAQEPLWNAVAQAMRDNEMAFRTNLAERTRGTPRPSALEDLKTFQLIADHHAAGLKKFIPPFEALYQSLPPAQQKLADRAFGDRSNSGGM